jgi:ABC-2 type transport system permease protein
MNYLKQVITVTRWEFSRFFKPKNEALGIVVMLLVSVVTFFATRYLMKDSVDKTTVITMVEDTELPLINYLSEYYIVDLIAEAETPSLIESLGESKDRILLEKSDEAFIVRAYKSSRLIKKLKTRLTDFHQQQEMKKIGLSAEILSSVLSPAPVVESYVYTDNSGKRLVLSYFFAGLMVMAVFLSFAYQFTAITGEKQLRITEQIVSAINPQVWMDGKIFGITLTGIASMLTYSMISIIGGALYFQFTGLPVSGILDYLYFPSIIIYLPFSLIGILIWNAILAAIASVITDPNNSGKSSLMMLPVLFVAASFMVIRDPDSGFSVFLSWFPLTSATSMPIRWAITEVNYWQLAGSFIVLVLTFYYLRILAAKVFRVTILISGKEPSFREAFKLARKV